MTAEELLNKLEAAEMIAPEVVASLRKQVAAAKEPIAVTAITKLLVDKGHLTAGQAQRLIGVPAGASVSTIQKAAASSAVAKSPAPAKPKPAPAATAAAASSSCIHDDLGLAPLEELGSAAAASTVAKSAVAKAAAMSTTKTSVQPAAPAAPQPKPQITPVGLDDLGLAPLEELEAPPPTKAPAAPVAKAAPAAAPKPAPKPAAAPALDDLGLAPLEELEAPSAPAPAPQADPAKSAVQKAAAAKSTIQKAPVAKSGIQKSSPQPAAATGLADLPPLDDLGAGLDPLGDLPPLDTLSPLDADPLGGPAGHDPFSSPLGATADLGAIASQANAAAQPRAAQAAATAAATAAANESRTTMLVGVGLGAAALLAVVVGLAVYLWPRGSGMAEFQAAEQAYQEKQYPVAIEKYDELLRLHPRHEQASVVRVHRGFARILAEHGSSPNFERLLPVVTAATSEIAAEPAVAEIHKELAPLLVQMTESLADQATSQRPSEQSTARLDAARSALALCNDARLLPSALRPWQKLTDIDERLQLAAREQGRAKFRDDWKTQISQKLTATSGDFTFLKERAQFLAKYPELASDSLWTELGYAIATAANKCVKVSSDKREAEQDPATSPLLANVPWQILNARLSEAPPAAGERVTLVAAAGSVHALDLQTGQPRWSRFLGTAADERPLVSADGRIAWLVDRRVPELVSVNAASGNFLWSQALAQAPLGSPLLVDGKLYLSLPNGQVHCFDASSGELQATATLPQELSVGPVATADGKSILQIASEGLIYVLSAGDLKNTPANYGWLGHDRGAVIVPPTVFQQQLIVSLQRGEQTELLVVSLEAGQPTLKRQKLDGNIAAPLTVAGQRLLASTAQGKVHLLQLDPDATEPFKLVQTLPAPSGSPVIRYWQRTPDGLLAADRGATQLKFDAAGKLQPGWSAFPADLFDAPLQVHDQTGVGVRFVADHGACYATALNLTDGQALWQTAVSVPLAVIAGNQEGSQPFAIPAPALAKLLATSDAAALSADFKRLLTQSSHSNLKAPPIVDVLPLGDERLIVPARGARDLLIVNVQDFTARKLKLPGQLAGSPAVSGQSLLVPLVDGSIQALRIAGGEVTAAPYVVPGNLAAAALPVSVIAIGEEGKDALVSDGKSSLYRISLVTEPKPHWAEQAAVRLAEPLAAPPGLVADMILAVDRQGQAHSLTLPDLATGPVVNMKQGQVTWGPHRAGDCLLLATDRDELWCFDVARQPRWTQPLTAGQLVGLPLVKDNKLILTARSGQIEVRAAGSGDLTASTDLQQTLAGSALLSGNSLWLSTTGGQVLQTAVPTQEAKK